MDIKILIVDDRKEYIQTAIEYIIEDAIPYAILCAPNGEKGIEIAQKELPDIIIMDWEMPGIDGVLATKRLKQNELTKDIPIIIATGIRMSPENLKKAFDAGASDFLRKPLEKTEFLARINSHLKQAEYLKKIKAQSKIIDNAENEKLNDIITVLETSSEENHEIINFYDSIISNILVKIKKIETTKHNEINEIISALDLASKKVNIIKNKQYYPNKSFAKKLLKKHSNLTPKDIQLSFYIKNDLQTKEIAELSFREVGSIKVARSRLRKKLGLLETENLCTYLNSF